MVARGPSDRTTNEWLHHARRDDGARCASVEDVKGRAIPWERRLTATFRVRTILVRADDGMNPIVMNALPAAEGGPTTCIDEH